MLVQLVCCPARRGCSRGSAGPDSVRLSLQTAHRFPLAGECPLFSAWGRFEDGAPAPRDRILRKGLVLLVLAHTEKALRDTGEPFLLLICGWSDGLRTMLAASFGTAGTRTMLAGECPLCGAPISEWASRLEDGAPATHVR